jgi:hypothetical protein
MGPPEEVVIEAAPGGPLQLNIVNALLQNITVIGGMRISLPTTLDNILVNSTTISNRACRLSSCVCVCCVLPQWRVANMLHSRSNTSSLPAHPTGNGIAIIATNLITMNAVWVYSGTSSSHSSPSLLSVVVDWKLT